MSKKQFLIAQGFTCPNWYWSWSYVNHTTKTVCFGEWDNAYGLILSPVWRINVNGRVANGFQPSLDNLKLVMEGGYKLVTFRLFGKNSISYPPKFPAKIDSYEPLVVGKSLERIGNYYYARDLK
jgi:hypothetical protein